ncbi:Sua5/YciO/YrdC/YwlC family protein [Candidatus Woesearchaeota archaeon]|nr:Sua5/YciO/YrdC/YwlC family protein [Candidatus Woesearchaeota archaeon]MBW3018184.1 Sua5/YciO/YrdC/YwlC family protein [Candidatus Woesearchaeota archaeon]
MRVINKDEFRINKVEFFNAIVDGAIFVYPTDTIYGLGCNAESEKAVHRLRVIKEKMEQPFSVIAPSKEWILANCKAKAEDLKELPGPVTLILDLKNEKCVAPNVNPQGGTIGVRIPFHWISGVVSILGVPIITTNVNKGGGIYMKSLDDLNPKLKTEIDFIVYEDKIDGKPSKVINLSSKK